MTDAPPRSFASSAPTLSKEEVERFSRQIMVEGIGAEGMARIRAGHVCCVGAGGLGSTIALYLVAAGVGHLTVVDFDEVELSNLHRQVIHTHARVGERKVDSARAACLAIYPEATVTAMPVALSAANAEDILRTCDVVVDGSDNVAARYLINDAAVRLGRPLVSGSAMRWEGQLTIYGYRGGPCYRCLFPVPPPAAAVGSCSDTGVVGPVPGMIGCLQALEVLKVLAGAGEPLAGRMLVFDGLRMRMRVVALRPRQATTCAACGDSCDTRTPLAALAATRPEYAAVSGCEAGGPAYSHARLPETARCTPEAFAAEWRPRTWARREGRWPLCVDVRTPVQFDMCHLPGSYPLPLAQLQEWARSGTLTAEWSTFLLGCVALDAAAAAREGEGAVTEAVPPLRVFLLCRRGVASVEATLLLQEQLAKGTEAGAAGVGCEAIALAELINVDGGLHAYHATVDRGFPYY